MGSTGPFEPVAAGLVSIKMEARTEHDAAAEMGDEDEMVSSDSTTWVILTLETCPSVLQKPRLAFSNGAHAQQPAWCRCGSQMGANYD